MIKTDELNRIRRTLIGAATLGCLGHSIVRAQDTKRTVIVAYLPSDAGQGRIRREFANHGWVHGRNADIRYVDVCQVKPDWDALVRRIVDSRPDAIFNLPCVSMAPLMRLTKEIPIVFHNLSIDPTKLGWVESLRRPGSNVTGTCHDFELVNVKIWSFMKEIRPGLKRAGEVRFPVADARNDFSAVFPRMKSVGHEIRRLAAQKVGVEIIDVELPRHATLELLVDSIRKARLDAVSVDDEVLSIAGVGEFLNEARIPRIGNINKGALLFITFDFDECAAQAIAMVARILRGESPATMPVYMSTRYGLALNLRAAREMGFTVPASIRVLATKVIE